MKRNTYFTVLFLFLTFLSLGCSDDTDHSSNTGASRNFSMGFTTWSFGPNLQDVDDTYDFIDDNADIYVEHLDHTIPWNAYRNNLPLPPVFSNEILGRVNRKLETKELVLSIGLLNNNRDDLAEDIDGSVPVYTALNDEDIIDAYTKHVAYLANQFSPDYLVIAIEVNELLLRNPSLWPGYESMIAEVTSRTRMAYPHLKIGASISLHNLFKPDNADTENYIATIWNHVDQFDFVGISYYPFLKNQSSSIEFQEAFDFLHRNTTRPIAVVESGHIAEDLIVPNLDVSISGNPTQQNAFLETLFDNAQAQDYLMVVWWAHRDYDALWEIFPTEVRDIGRLWRDTGLIDEAGDERLALRTWQSNFAK